MSVHRNCCCGQFNCDLRDTVFGSEISDGCCHLADELLLWCERPGSTQLTQTVAIGPPPRKEIDYQLICDTCDPIVAIYKYYGCFYRCAYSIPGVGLEYFCNLPDRCTTCPGPPPGVQPCEPLQQDWLDCCDEMNPTNCECNANWLSPRRKSILSDEDPLYPSPCKWLVDIACHKNGQALCDGFSLANRFLGVVYFERWWKIPDGIFSEEYCDPGVRIRIPDCQGLAGSSVNGSTVVPYWWIYAGAGIPLYDFDIADAVNHGVITNDEATDLANEMLARRQPLQSTLQKLAAAGYFTSKDWREEQANAYAELNARFPGAGYAACLTGDCSLPELGPFRKRYTPATPVANAHPCLSIDDLYTTAQGVNPTCEIDYPGNPANTADYQYWADRQWTYWRGLPGGWQWGGWEANPTMLLDGLYRGATNCIEGFKNSVRGSCTCIQGPCTGLQTYCCGCGEPSPECSSPFPLQNCENVVKDFTCIGLVPTYCENLMLQPQCEGVQFAYFKSYFQNAFDPTQNRMKCLFTARSFLVEAKRSTEWNPNCVMGCNIVVPALSMFQNWFDLSFGSVASNIFCDALSGGSAQPTPPYDNNQLCCGTYCYEFDANGCMRFDSIRNDCIGGGHCPPTLTPQQSACLGYDPTCGGS